MTESAQSALENMANENGANIDTSMKKIRLKTSTTEKMQRFYPLFADNLGSLPKESEIIAFMTELAFENFVSSGEIKKKLEEIASKG